MTDDDYLEMRSWKQGGSAQSQWEDLSCGRMESEREMCVDVEVFVLLRR